jgi:hypothetical protein
MRIAGPLRALPPAVALGAAALLVTGPAAGTAAAAAGAPAADAVPLVEGGTATARLDVPYPGHSTAFEVVARAASAGPADLTLLVDGGTGPLASGPDGLRLVLEDAAGRVLAAGTPAELAAAPVDLGTIGAEPVTVRATASLPATAGDELQGVGLTLRLGLVATQDLPAAADPDADPGPGGVASGVLATTGARVAAAALAAVALVTAGLLALAARRRHRTEEDA